jgi:hypothetical protein
MIEIITGNVNTRGRGSLRLMATYRAKVTAREQPLYVAEKDEKAGIRVIGQVDVFPSSEHRDGQVWSKKRYEFPDNSLVKLTINRTRAGVSFAAQQHAIYIVPRSWAALRRIGIDLPSDSKSAITVAYIEGRFDILDLDDLEALKLLVNQQGNNEAHIFDPENYEDFIVIETLSKALPKPKVTSNVVVDRRAEDGGAKKAVMRLKKTRKLNV